MDSYNHAKTLWQNMYKSVDRAKELPVLEPMCNKLDKVCFPVHISVPNFRKKKRIVIWNSDTYGNFGNCQNPKLSAYAIF